MKVTPEMIDAMLASGLTAEQALMAVKGLAGVKSNDAVRKARSRSNVTDSHGQSRTKRDNPDSHSEPLPPFAPLDKETSPPPPKEINPPYIPPTPKTANEFAEWYSRYPNKVGKPEAQRAFAKARTKTSLESLNEGLTRYLAKTDDRPWCNPATWLNQERWGDEPAQVARGSPRPVRTDPVRNVIASLLDKMETQDAEPAAQIEGREPPTRLLSSQQFGRS